jgi:hypothetical protein
MSDRINPRKVALRAARKALHETSDEYIASLAIDYIKRIPEYGIKETKEAFCLGTLFMVEVGSKVSLVETFGSAKTASRALYKELRFVLLQKALKGCMKKGLQKCKKLGRKLNLRGNRQDRRKEEK